MTTNEKSTCIFLPQVEVKKRSIQKPTIKTRSPKRIGFGPDADLDLSFPEQERKSLKLLNLKLKKSWDIIFNKKKYCEVYNLTFTLLTRRHHCQTCEISCCVHCSKFLIVGGCNET